MVCILLFALSMGRTRTLVSLLSIYVAFVLQAVFPYFGWLQTNAKSLTSDLPTLRIGFLLVAYIVSFVILSRSVLKKGFGLGDSSFITVIIMGLLQLGLLASIILNLAPAYQSYLPAKFLPYIAQQKALFYWALAPVLLLVFQKGD